MYIYTKTKGPGRKVSYKGEIFGSYFLTDKISRRIVSVLGISRNSVLYKSLLAIAEIEIPKANKYWDYFAWVNVKKKVISIRFAHSADLAFQVSETFGIEVFLFNFYQYKSGEIPEYVKRAIVDFWRKWHKLSSQEKELLDSLGI